MNRLEELRSKNPGLSFYSVVDPEFRRFGRVIDYPADKLIAACEAVCEMPEAGSEYLPDIPALESNGMLEEIAHTLRGDGSTQIGCCWGHSSTMNCLEYHRASEHNIAVSDMVLLLAAQQDMEGNDLPEGKVTAFYFPKGTTIEVYATTLHYCPCEVSEEGFRCIVILPRGTNQPLRQERPQVGDGRLLWAQDKWLICHPENEPMITGGAYPGLHGENFTVEY